MVKIIKCVVFDFGDTLVDSSKAVVKAREKHPEKSVLARVGFKFSKNRLDAAFKRMTAITQKLPHKARSKDKTIFARVFLECLGLKSSLRLALKCERAFYEQKEKEARLFPYVLQTLRFLKKKGIIQCVVTNTRNDFNARICKRLKIKNFFKIFLASHRFGSVKNDLKIFHELLKRLNKARKNKIKFSECLMVGGRLDEDGAAKQLGMKVAILKPLLKDRHNLERIKPDYFINSIKEIQAIVKAENNC